MAKEYDNPEIPDVRTALDQLTVDSLKQLLNLLSDESKPTRKADCVASIERCLSGEKLKALWERLDDTQKLAVAELFEYAATLGLVDVAYIEPWEAKRDFCNLWGVDDMHFLSRYDGLIYFRINPLGAYCLGLADQYQPSRPKAKAVLQVLPSLHVSVVSEGLTLEETLFLDIWAERDSDSLWRLDRDKILQAVERGQRVAELSDFLAARDGQGLPQTVEGFLAVTARQACTLKNTGSVLLVECADEDLAEQIAKHEQTQSLCQRVGPRHLAVKVDAEERFRQAVHGLGYGMLRG